MDPEELLNDTQEYVGKRKDKYTPEKRATIRLDRKLWIRKMRRKQYEAEAEERERLEAERKAKRIAEIRKKAAEESLLGNKY